MTVQRYTCADYRQEMVLLGLRKRLRDEQLSDAQREKILREIHRLEMEMGMD